MLESSPEKPKWHIEAIEQGKIPVWNYVDGCMMTSLISLSGVTGDDKYIDYVKNFIDYFVNDEGEIKGFSLEKQSIDDISASRNLFALYNKYGDQKYLKAIELTYQQVSTQPRIKTNNFWHKKIYPHQVWLDGLYMAMPFYAKYLNYNNIDNFSDIVGQYKTLREILFNDKDQLYYHAHDESREMFWADKTTGNSPNYWSRSMGWLVASMVDVFPYLVTEKQKSELKLLFMELVTSLISYLDQDQFLLYNLTTIKDDKNYLETSSSALLSYALLKGYRIGVLTKEHYNTGVNILNSLTENKLVKSDGVYKLKDVCLVSGLGPESKPWRDGSVQYYMSEPISYDDGKGSGPYIMAFAEMLRIEKEGICENNSK